MENRLSDSSKEGIEECKCGHHHEQVCTLDIDSNNKNIKYLLKGLDCAGCAAKIEAKVNDMDEVLGASLNFSMATLIVQTKNEIIIENLNDKIKKIVNTLEPDVTVINLDKTNGNIKNKKEYTFNNQQLIDKNKVITISIGTIFFFIALFFKLSSFVQITLLTLSYLLIGGRVLVSAFKNILKGQIFDEKFLMVIATVGAFAIKEFPEAVAVMLFYEIGESFQDFAVNRSRKSIVSLMDIRPDKANLKVKETIKEVSPENVHIEDVILVKPGEKVPLDGIILDGDSMIDTSALTGESVPKKVSKGDEILSGTINKSGLLEVRVTKNFSESTVSKILDLVQNAGAKKAQAEKFITKFARYYTPIVVSLALVLAVIPPLVIKEAMFNDWVRRALIFLVVSCPCALVVSVPLGFFAGIGCASKNGILIKGGNYLEALNYVDTIVFDKTGTLTKGVFEVTSIKPVKKIDKNIILKYAAYSEVYSNHPIAKSILKIFNRKIDKSLIKNYSEIEGCGIKVQVDGEEVLSGNEKLMKKFNINFEKNVEIGTVIYIAVNKKYMGYIVISDRIKDDSKEAIKKLKQIGINKTVMLTGDSKTVGEEIAKQLNIDEVYTELLPQNKVEIFEQKLNDSDKNKKIAFVGDGVNDAPVLARADVGIAMGGIGSDAAIEAADVVLMTDEPSKLSIAIKIAKNTRNVVTQNIVVALVVKVGVLMMATFGLGNMWTAVFADVGVSLLAVLNSMRVLKTQG